MTILIQHGAFAQSYEKQVNKIGYTYGKSAEWVQEVGDCITQIWVQGLVTDKEYDRILDRFHKKILMNKKYLKKCADTIKAESEE